MAKKIVDIRKKEDLRRFIHELRVFASNNKSDKVAIEIIENSIKKARIIDDKKSIVNLYELKISQIEHLYERIDQISELMLRMREISLEIDYNEGLALSYNIEWYIEKFKGNKDKSRKALDYSIKILSNHKECDKYSYFVCYYSYAFEQWLEENNPESVIIFEECIEFFYKNGFYRSLVQILAVLSVIYRETQNGKKAIKITQKLLGRKIPFNNLPLDIQAYSYYFVGLSHKLQLNLSLAERYLTESRNIFEETLERSIYSVYYLPVLSHLSTILALQGKMEQALELIKIAEKLLKKNLYSNYLDPTSKSQIIHSLNLVKFYVKSRIFDRYNKITELIDDVYRGIKVNYSNAIMVTEFLLNANLNVEQLEELKDTNNASLKRVKHIIKFLIEKERFKLDLEQKQQNEILIKTLQERFKENKMTYIEKAYSDLLIAQQLFSSKCYAEIYPLLKKYEKQLHRIEVLELRIFMEAFIQVGAYKNGDLLGPALQYMAIKKCRMHGFFRLERTLEDYLGILRQDVLNMRFY